MLYLFCIVLVMFFLGSLFVCMKFSDLVDGVDYYLCDVGVFDYSVSQCSNNWWIQVDFFIYIGQGLFVLLGYWYVWLNVVVEQVFEGFVEYFLLVCCVKVLFGLDDVMCEVCVVGVYYLLYCCFVWGDNRIGNWEEWEDEEEFGWVGCDCSVIQVMLIEISICFLVDSVIICSCGGFLMFYDVILEDLLCFLLE